LQRGVRQRIAQGANGRATYGFFFKMKFASVKLFSARRMRKRFPAHFRAGAVAREYSQFKRMDRDLIFTSLKILILAGGLRHCF